MEAPLAPLDPSLDPQVHRALLALLALQVSLPGHHPSRCKEVSPLFSSSESIPRLSLALWLQLPQGQCSMRPVLGDKPLPLLGQPVSILFETEA